MTGIWEEDICIREYDNQEEEIRDVFTFNSILDAGKKAGFRAYVAWLKQEVGAGRKHVSKTLEVIWKLGVQI